MEKHESKSIFSGLLGFAAGLNPFTSITFLLALLVTAFAAWVWFQHSGEASQSFPIYGTVGASYAGGYLIGRIFRRLLKIAVIAAAVVLGGFALINRMHLDTSKAEQAVKAGSAWLEDQSMRARNYLMDLLPSGAAGGFGAFAGARKGRRDLKEQA